MVRYDETSRVRDSYESEADEARGARRARGSREDHAEREENNSGGRTARFLLGVGIGLGIALLFAPQSGEETRRWLMDKADDRYRRLRRQGRRLIFETQDLLDRGEQGVTRVLRSGKHALESVADKLDEHTKS
jgi:gas vesicle protein